MYNSFIFFSFSHFSPYVYRPRRLIQLSTYATDTHLSLNVVLVPIQSR